MAKLSSAIAGSVVELLMTLMFSLNDGDMTEASGSSVGDVVAVVVVDDDVFDAAAVVIIVGIFGAIAMSSSESDSSILRD